MKRIVSMIFFFLVVSLGLYAIKKIKLGEITGQIYPIDQVNAVMLINGRDTITLNPIQGVFRFQNLKQGVYGIIVKANAPYKDFTLKNVAVKDSSTTRLASIILK